MNTGFKVQAQADPVAWDDLIASFPQPHVMQSWEWGRAKLRNGWLPYYCTWGTQPVQAAALVLARQLPLGGFAARLGVMYAPKGPLMRDWGDESLRATVLGDLKTLAQRKGAIFIKIDPDVEIGGDEILDSKGTHPPDQQENLGRAVSAELRKLGWIFSAEQVQFRNTMLVDLTLPEDELLAGMKQKTRYNIRLAQRKGVQVRVATATDLDLLYRMYAETSVRDGFVIRGQDYYHALWGEFMQAQATAGQLESTDRPSAEGLVAEAEGEPLAGLVVFRFAGRAWYMFGMSRALQREKMPNYLLQWEAMRRAKAAGSTLYDLWGAPDHFLESDPMWGVYRFKEGLGARLARHLGAWDCPVRPFYYRLYTQTLPRLLDWMRRRGVTRTRQALKD